MKSISTAGRDKSAENASNDVDALLNPEAMTIADLERTSRLLSSRLEARKQENRRVNIAKSSDLYRHNSYVAHVERFVSGARADR
jgi:hypothetical protein